jgi:hypothetical protein
MLRRIFFGISITTGLLIIFFARANAAEINGVHIETHASVSESYDDNVTMVKDDAKDDLVTNIRPGISAVYEDDRKSWAVSADINQPIFVTNPKFNKPYEFVDVSFKQELTKYDRISITDAFKHTYEPVSFSDVFVRTTGRYGYYTNDLALGYERDLSKQGVFKADYAHRLDEFSRGDLSDAYMNSFGFGLDYALDSATQALLAYNFANRNFSPGDDATKNTLSLTMGRFLTKQLSLKGQAGVEFISAYDNSNMTKPLFLVSLEDEINETTGAGLTFLKVYDTNAYVQDMFNKWEVSGYLNRELLKNLVCSLTAFYGTGKYVDSGIRDTVNGQ